MQSRLTCHWMLPIDRKTFLYKYLYLFEITTLCHLVEFIAKLHNHFVPHKFICGKQRCNKLPELIINNIFRALPSRVIFPTM